MPNASFNIDVGISKCLPGVNLSDIVPLNNLLLYVNFDKSIVGLYYIHILSILAKFQCD